MLTPKNPGQRHSRGGRGRVSEAHLAGLLFDPISYSIWPQYRLVEPSGQLLAGRTAVEAAPQTGVLTVLRGLPVPVGDFAWSARRTSPPRQTRTSRYLQIRPLHRPGHGFATSLDRRLHRSHILMPPGIRIPSRCTCTRAFLRLMAVL